MTSGTGLPEPGRLRASDADREAVAGVLHQAMAQGRITVDELTERLDTVYRAKTLGELEPVTRDLPEHLPLVPPQAAPEYGRPRTLAAPANLPTSSTAVAIFSGAERKGDWAVPPTFTATAVMGGVELDFSQAAFLTDEVVVTVVAIMGGIDITVPDDAAVKVDGVGIMGGFDHSVPPPEGTPRVLIRIRGLAFWGGVDVHRMTAKQRKRLAKNEAKERKKLS
jgi:hypothetical protein